MKFIRNIFIVLIFSSLLAGGYSMFYYTNEYRYSYTDIAVNEPAENAAENDSLAEFFKRVLQVSDEEVSKSCIYLMEPQFYVTTHVGGLNQRTYDIYVSSVMTRTAYIHDTKTDKLYKMSPSAFVSFFTHESIAPYAYSFAEPCEMTLEGNGIQVSGKASICDWNYITADGTYLKVKSLPDGGEISASVKGSDDFTVSLPYAANFLRANVYTEDGEVLFNGDLYDGKLPCIDKDGIIYYEVTAVWSVDPSKDFYGTAKYVFAIENDVPVSISAEKVSVYQGEFIRLFAENAGETDVYSASCPELGYEAVFFETENGMISLLPVSCDAVPGIYTINITENGASRPLEIEVKEQSFEKGTLTISTERTPEDEAELEAMLTPFRTHVSERVYMDGAFSIPVEGKITTSFGLHRYTNGSDTFTIHNGLDIAASGKPDILAAQNGIVVYVGELSIPGKTVVIDHGMNVLSYYYHMSSINVAVGQVVTTGTKVGNMGSTGYSTGDHLHFTVMINGVATNPTSLYSFDPSSEMIK